MENGLMEGDAEKRRKKKNPGGGTGAFGVLGLNKSLCLTLERKFRYKQPSAIQRKTIPLVLKRTDVVCIARTGSGKTIAYLAPIIQLLDVHSTTVGSRCLVLLPSRELALQVASVVKKFVGKTDGLRHATLIGGQALETQFGSLAFNPDIVIATPGRLSQHLVEKSFDMSLLEHFVIDEADKLFEMGFLPDVYRVFSMLPENRQVVLVSATLPSEVSEFVSFGLSNPAVTKIDQDMQINEQLELAFVYSRIILFVATKHHVEFFRCLLTKNGHKVSAVYGSMDMSMRTSQMSQFQSFKTTILIVTDLAARGLDLPLVDIVVNFDFPHSSKLFIHRVGRTARAGKQGLAVSLLTLYDFAFCFEILETIGRKMAISGATPEGSEGGLKNDTCMVGTVGNVVSWVEKINEQISNDSELESLNTSMENSYNLYYKTRPNPSNIAIDKSQSLLESLGGIAVIAASVHPLYTGDVQTPQGSGDENQQDARNAILDYLHGFRPTALKTTMLTTVSQESIDVMTKRKEFAQKFMVSRKNRDLGKLLNNDVNVPAEVADVNVELAPSKDSFLVPSASSNEELHLPNITLNITPDTEELMQKTRFQRKQQWNPKRKRFMDVTVDTMTNRVIKNESGLKVKKGIENKGQLKQWMKKSSQRIQKVGEQENVKKGKRMASTRDDHADDENVTDFEELKTMFPKHAATFEAAQLKHKLTHKQKRTIKRLTTKPSADKPEKRELQKKVSKKKKRTSKAEFQKKQMRKIAAKGAPGRSKVIVRKNKGKKR
ncbi:DEAD box ATP-dependent RNA helicase family member protein [Theileria equi strain WA]|uniref:RNA helicase n=1 Tax=Theileria equi strain WA TaxID=1537102 RepID=L1LBA2_THEEQ|nr:DEAD box ATP-dependent RNA helicase family member protein [Theileria equi strain WA]EKX72549.1 DEAD box ATP-dependent RNA helicase family member protein [Theileria equi strain WA]|eukprot:XP_004832001.1 DEAD box ATP-dependent RNA helicase family member protein [Theileria equi strain WA]